MHTLCGTAGRYATEFEGGGGGPSLATLDATDSTAHAGGYMDVNAAAGVGYMDVNQAGVGVEATGGYMDVNAAAGVGYMDVNQAGVGVEATGGYMDVKAANVDNSVSGYMDVKAAVAGADVQYLDVLNDEEV
jgi:hypothetical protein